MCTHLVLDRHLEAEHLRFRDPGQDVQFERFLDLGVIHCVVPGTPRPKRDSQFFRGADHRRRMIRHADGAAADNCGGTGVRGVGFDRSEEGFEGVAGVVEGHAAARARFARKARAMNSA